jgi:mannose-6-phosphate isomerase-like protein (cupin superfamily)
MAGQENGLVTEGYHQEGEFGLGYYLSEVPLIKLLEKTGKDISTVHAFDFDGETHQFRSTTEHTRLVLTEFLEERKVFKSWNRYGSLEEGFSFQTDPTWQVKVNPETHTYTIADSTSQPIVEVTAIDNSDRKDFATYVNAQLSKDLGIPEAKYKMEYLELDLDYKHNIYFHPTRPQQFYILSGNNQMFYKVTVSNQQQAQLLMRTLEFNDTINEDIGL